MVARGPALALEIGVGIWAFVAKNSRPIQSLGVDSPQLAAVSQRPIQSPSFPHVLSGNPGQSGSGPRTKTFRGDGMGGVRMIGLRYPAACCGVVHCSKVQGSVQRERAVLRTSNFESLFRSLLHPTARFVINITSRAGVVEWQTRRTQNPVGVTLCGFKSRLRHQRYTATPAFTPILSRR